MHMQKTDRSQWHISQPGTSGCFKRETTFSLWNCCCPWAEGGWAWLWTTAGPWDGTEELREWGPTWRAELLVCPGPCPTVLWGIVGTCANRIILTTAFSSGAATIGIWHVYMNALYLMLNDMVRKMILRKFWQILCYDSLLEGMIMINDYIWRHLFVDEGTSAALQYCTLFIMVL